MSLSGQSNPSGFRAGAFAVLVILVLICVGGFMFLMSLRQETTAETPHRAALPTATAVTAPTPMRAALPQATPNFNPPLPPMPATSGPGQFTD